MREFWRGDQETAHFQTSESARSPRLSLDQIAHQAGHEHNQLRQLWLQKSLPSGHGGWPSQAPLSAREGRRGLAFSAKRGRWSRPLSLGKALSLATRARLTELLACRTVSAARSAGLFEKRQAIDLCRSLARAPTAESYAIYLPLQG